MVYFALAVHNHQPVGNFEHILEEAYQRAYAPFLQMLYNHPRIKLTLHYTGILWEWFAQAHPEFLERLQAMAGRQQIELMSGGFYEPILSVLPEEDQRGQIDKMNCFLRKQFGAAPRGLWLAERVWEPHLVKTIAESGLEYVIVDDSHFREVGLENERLLGFYISEESGYTVKVFPGDMTLRYLIPFHSPEETIDYLRAIHEKHPSAIVQMGDDGEKFGVWPGTHHTVYNEGWLERFFALLEENGSWLKCRTYAELVQEHKALGNIYLPTASYSEMMEWALPTPQRAVFEQIKARAERTPECRPCLSYLKGGLWRNFLVKYPESNFMHKKMLYISRKIQKLGSFQNIQILEYAKNELWQGQCNCAYWHGVFGGLYLPHLRKGIYEHLIKAEKLLDQLTYSDKQGVETQTRDLLLNGTNTVIVSNPKLNFHINPDMGGAVQEWDYKPASLNLGNIMSRRPEAYHETVKNLAGRRGPQEGAQSIHHIQNLKEDGLDKYLVYDRYQRLSLIDHFLPPESDLNAFYRGAHRELGDFVEQPYRFRVDKHPLSGLENNHFIPHTTAALTQKASLLMVREGAVFLKGQSLPVKTEKTFSLEADSKGFNVRYRISNLSERALECLFGCEFNIAPAYPDGTFWEVPGTRGSLYDPAEAHDFRECKLVIDYIKLCLEFSFSKKTALWSLPLYTVSQAEGGYERIYQGQTMLFHWPLKVAPHQTWELKIDQITT